MIFGRYKLGELGKVSFGINNELGEVEMFILESQKCLQFLPSPVS